MRLCCCVQMESVSDSDCCFNAFLWDKLISTLVDCQSFSSSYFDKCKSPRQAEEPTRRHEALTPGWWIYNGVWKLHTFSWGGYSEEKYSYMRMLLVHRNSVQLMINLESLKITHFISWSQLSLVLGYNLWNPSHLLSSTIITWENDREETRWQ